MNELVNKELFEIKVESLEMENYTSEWNSCRREKVESSSVVNRSLWKKKKKEQIQDWNSKGFSEV